MEVDSIKLPEDPPNLTEDESKTPEIVSKKPELEPKTPELDAQTPESNLKTPELSPKLFDYSVGSPGNSQELECRDELVESEGLKVKTGEDQDAVDKSDGVVAKPTFKNALQAKKRLQAFSSNRAGSLPSSPSTKRSKLDEKSEEAKKPAKKVVNPNEKAKAVIEEIEEIKREEQALWESQKYSRRRSKSGSRSPSKGKFRKVEKKSRNYRRRSSTPERLSTSQKTSTPRKSSNPRKSTTPQKASTRQNSSSPHKLPKLRRQSVPKLGKYPKSWEEFFVNGLNFDLNKDFDQPVPTGYNEPLAQIRFQSPSLPINSFTMKTASREDKVVPFRYLRYTRTSPVICHSVNFTNVKETHLSRKLVLNSLPKEIITIIENLYSNSFKFTTDLSCKTSREWFPKDWIITEENCNILEKSSGLSFLQNYKEIDEGEILDDQTDQDLSGILSQTISTSDEYRSKKVKSEVKKNHDRHEKSQGELESNQIVKMKKPKKDKKEKRGKIKEKKLKKKKLIKEKKKKDKKHESSLDDTSIKNKEQSRNTEKLMQLALDVKQERVRKRKHSESDVKTKKQKRGDTNCQELSKLNEKEESKENQTKEQNMYIDLDSVIKTVSSVTGNENLGRQTPDTDEYHSHWESDEDITPALPPRQSIKMNRNWESDEELFDRSRPVSKVSSPPLTSLEIPLNIIKFPPRTAFENEMKLLEEERKSLIEERKRLELEKQQILKMKGESVTKTGLELNEPPLGTDPLEFEPVQIKKEICDISVDSFNSSMNNLRLDSNLPIGALENEYEEFIKAVNNEGSIQSKKKPSRSSSSQSSSSSSSSDHKRKKRKKKKKKRKKKEVKGNIFDEFDIPVPSDLIEIPPVPVPVPSPISKISLNTSNLLLQSIIAAESLEKQKDEPDLNTSKPFIFPSLVFPLKRNPILDPLKLNEDSNSTDFTDKFVKKDSEEVKVGDLKVDNPILNEKPHIKVVQVIKEVREENPVKNEEQKTTSENKGKYEDKKKMLPVQKSPVKRDKRRSRSRSRGRKSPARRRDSSLTKQKKYPRKRSPPRRRLSPRRRSPSPKRRSPARRRRRSTSMSPPRSRIRKRTPSPKHRKMSPLNSPLDGFKKSVADSTISDDMLPQRTPDEYCEQEFQYKKDHTRSTSPQLSPKRISLDDRINQVLGLEKPDEMKPSPMGQYAPNYQYPQTYNQQYEQFPQYNQYHDPRTEYPQFSPGMFSRPPPPLPKPPPSNKVVQVGNILQVVPSEDVMPMMTESKAPETSQKILQVGNMLQIVPANIPIVKTPVPVEPPEPIKPVAEIQSAEAMMKQKNAERRAEREKRRDEREQRRKDKEKKRKDKEKRKQIKYKLKTENMIKKAIQMETEALASEDLEETENLEPLDFPPVPIIISSSTPSCKGILLIEGSSRTRKSVQFADGIKPGEGTSPSGGEELSSPPPAPAKLPKEKRYKKVKIPKKSKKRKIKVKVVKKSHNTDDDDEEDNLPPPSPPPGSPPPHVFPSRVKTHSINNIHPYIANMIQPIPPGANNFPFRPPMPPVLLNNRPPPPPPNYIGAMQGGAPYHPEMGVPHPTYSGGPPHH